MGKYQNYRHDWINLRVILRHVYPQAIPVVILWSVLFHVFFPSSKCYWDVFRVWQYIHSDNNIQKYLSSCFRLGGLKSQNEFTLKMLWLNLYLLKIQLIPLLCVIEPNWFQIWYSQIEFSVWYRLFQCVFLCYQRNNAIIALFCRKLLLILFDDHED